MAKKKATEEKKRIDPSVEGLHAEIVEQPICQTLETNYMILQEAHQVLGNGFKRYGDEL